MVVGTSAPLFIPLYPPVHPRARPCTVCLLMISDASGESGLGKTTFINTLFATEISTPRDYRNRAQKQLDKTTEVEILKADLEERGFNIKVGVFTRELNRVLISAHGHRHTWLRRLRQQSR